MLLSTFMMLSHVQSLALIFCRIFFAIVVFPLMEETKLPASAKVGLTLILSMVVYGTFLPQAPIQTLNVTTFFIMLLKECIVGLILGFGVAFFFQIYYFVGHLLSMQGGLGMSNMYDPASGMQTPVVGRFYFLGFCAIFMASGGFHWFITAIVESFQTIPLAEAAFSQELVTTVIKGMSVFWELSLKLASPIIGVIFIVDCGLGILARTVPQMNMFVIGLPLKLIILLVLLSVTLIIVPAYNQVIIEHIVGFTNSLIQGLVPR